MAVKKKRTKTLRVKKQGSTPMRVVVTQRVIAFLLIVILIGGLGFFAIKGSQALGRFLFSANPQFTIHEVDVVSDGKLSPIWLQSQADVVSGDNLFAVNPKMIAQELKISPRVQSVSITRQLPDHLIIDVKERFAVAQISYKEKNRYPQVIGADGVVMAPKGSVATLPLIYGVAEFEDQRNLRPGTHISAVAVISALDVLDWCNSSQWGRLVKIESIDAAYQDFLKVYLEDQTLVYVPQTRPQVLKGRLNRLVIAIKKADELGKQLLQVDLTTDGINVPVKYR